MPLEALLGLGSALGFGLSDFAAGLASRRARFWSVTATSLATSSVGAWLLVAAGGTGAGGGAVAWGAAAGLGAAVGAAALYRGYGRGQMAVAGPLSAVGAAALPAVVGAFLGDRLPPLGLTGIVLALPAIWLMAAGGSVGPRSGTSDGLISGCGFALEFVGLERAGDAGLWPVAVSQSTALALVLLLVVVRRSPVLMRDHGALPLAVLAGLCSLLATGLYFWASQVGLLTVAAVLASLYPGVPVALAAGLLGERPSRSQLAGLVLGAVAVTFVVLG
jgi:drug/metabolite transporter (DMT)-like permease